MNKVKSVGTQTPTEERGQVPAPHFLVVLNEGREPDCLLACTMALAIPNRAHLILFHMRDHDTLKPWYFTGWATRYARQTLEASLERA